MARKSFRASHLELRHHTYFAVLYVPRDVRQIIGKTKFSRSTETTDLRLAEHRAHAFVIGWKAEIARARHKSDDPLIAEALDLYTNLQEARREHIGLAQDFIEVIDQRAAEISASEHPERAQEFLRVATGRSTVLEPLVANWIEHEKSRGLKQKTIDQMSRDVAELVATFQSAHFLTSEYTTQWLRNEAQEKNLSASSVNRIVGSCANFFRYLQFIGEAEKDAPNPFQVPDEFKKSKKGTSSPKNKIDSWVPFTADEVVVLHRAAQQKGDSALADLIKMAAYTGARIEELCSLRCADIDLEEGSLKIRDAKTAAGVRTVPIHSKISVLIKGLVKTSADGYLLSGLTFNKYGDRSNAVGKRFGRLKKQAGHSDLHVFHSIRKTFVTLLENAKVAENIAADIVGHEKNTMTYGLYSGGTSLELKKQAIQKVSYKFS